MKNLILVFYSILIAGCSALNASDKNAELLDNLSLKEKESKEYIKQYNNILTLETALKLSVDRNLDLKVKIIEEEIAKLDKRIAFGNFLPKISLGYSYTMLNNKVMGEALDTGIPALPGFPAALEGRLLDKSFSLFNVNAQMPIFVPSTWFLYSARQKGENISVLTRELTEKMIKLQTIGEYYYILALESEREYLSKELASAQELNKNAKVALETESILKWEYEGTEQMVKMKEHALRQNERDLQSAKISLMNTLNLYPFLDIQLQKPSPFTENNISMEEAVYESLKNSDFIKIRDTAVDMNEDAVKIAVTNFLPKIILTGGYINTSNEALADPDFFMGTLGGFFSIFNGFQNVNEYKKARKNQEIAFIRKEQEIMKVIFETVNAYNGLESSKEERDIASKASADNAILQYDRAEKLYKADAMTKKNFDAVTAQKKAAVSLLKEAQQGVENAQNKLKDTELRAPFSGYISKKFADAGSVVNAGTPVVSLSADENPEVTISVAIKDTDILKNALSFIFVPNDSEKKYELKLKEIGKNPEFSKLTYPATFELLDGKDIRMGMSGKVIASIKRDESSPIIIPASALFEDNGSKVYIYDNGVAKAKKVKIGNLYPNGNIIILEGLNKNDKVITAGVNSIIDGEKVKLIPEESDTNFGNVL